MSQQEESEKEFSNWVKLVQGFMNARDGSINHIKSKVEPFVQKLLRMHGANDKDHFKELLNKVAVNGKVAKQHLHKKDPTKIRWDLVDNSCYVCEKIFEELLDNFKDSWYPCKEWICNSTKEQVKSSSYWWVLAKMYIAKPEIIDADKPEEVEPLEIFNLMKHCKLFDGNLNLSVQVKELVQLRHKLMHNANNRLTDKEMEDNFRLIKKFLKQVAENPTETIKKVEKLEASIVILFNDDGEYSEQVLEALRLQNISLKNDLKAPEGMQGAAITSVTASNIALKQLEMKLEESRKKNEELVKQNKQQEKELEESKKKNDELVKQKEDCQVPHTSLLEQTHSKETQDSKETAGCSDQVEPPVQLPTSYIYQVQSVTDVNMKVASDTNKCNISDMCQMPDGTIILIDMSNKKLKILDEECNVKDFYQFEKRPMSVTSVSSSQVVVLDETLKLNYINTTSHITFDRQVPLEFNHFEIAGYMIIYMIYCNDQFWIHFQKGIYIFSSSGYLVKCVVCPSLNRTSSISCTICINRDKTRVYVVTCNTVNVLDTDGKVLSTFPIRDAVCCISCTIDDVIMISSYTKRTVDMYDRDGKKLGTLIPESQMLRIPKSLLYDRKKDCLIIGSNRVNEVLKFQLKKSKDSRYCR